MTSNFQNTLENTGLIDSIRGQLEGVVNYMRATGVEDQPKMVRMSVKRSGREVVYSAEFMTELYPTWENVQQRVRFHVVVEAFALNNHDELAGRAEMELEIESWADEYTVG
jgi:hypothetical protein